MAVGPAYGRQARRKRMKGKDLTGYDKTSNDTGLLMGSGLGQRMI